MLLRRFASALLADSSSSPTLIDLNGNGEDCPFITGDSSIEEFAADPFWAASRGRLELAILRVAQDVAARPKAHRLKRSDLEDLQKAVCEALDAPVNA